MTARCEACSGPMAGKTTRARFCSPRCRSRAYRERRSGREPAAPPAYDQATAADQLAQAVEDMFSHPDLAGFDVATQRAAARTLVAIAADGGTPAVSAIRELRRVMADLEEALRR